ncbi:UDP-N-acetylmuramate dehydrogenase [Xanthomonas fragariae]|uniref:UDP-N-acetylenolpyruvoylglucosamine reductase n=1 Tax=Xanthomonas fragariae TaxID=48664 RepID=A0A1Y6H006_9XANT|nr:UDP-N-acetylmuramate dehydrogenase [Xanthomonas fragariae]AOD15124.1 UDP-N-acetylenolpyruvoylglucosamine reductase [Xanthomonas fragariae]AOD18523.1 UDP-N-acetylenolpyruvoylglucosamine reductase [Xanthomonas fragariae]ENZ93857.1 UDP-N-acetylenolpyruvoylglucosamine reductase [Xanthomonas fragariae LMG 25863]MBL9198442.1 UDP-N-acetylmuramate dehydrogenase [Xanthomonas fragariae]MBL9223014.1 UDP-N-acetylmuramate dehydrogenase [Xanthomonas fragariae]
MSDAVQAGWSMREHVPLRGLNTFHVDATARWLLSIHTPEALPQALAAPEIAGQPLLVLGSGSNVLLAGDPPGCVLCFDNRQIAIIAYHADHAIVRADAGVNWHALVLYSLQQGLSGLENLALIPGTVGACPIQNIGAYGAQVGDFIHVVEAFERQSQQFVRLTADECAFGYRDSVFKQQPDRYLIVAVEFNLPLLHELLLDYAGIREELTSMGAELAGAADVAQAVINLRRRKLPDPDVLGNAGSFFKNPLLPSEQIAALQTTFSDLPVHPGEHPRQGKLSAAWLIEQCGWKGAREGDAGVSPEHALVLVNYGTASGAQLLDFARRIAESVRERYSVVLEPEPRVIGAHW